MVFGMEFYLLFIVCAFVFAVPIFFLSRVWRMRLLNAIIVAMVFLALYNLSGAELGSVSVLASLTEVGMVPILFIAHPYARVVAFGILLVGSLVLLYGLEVADRKEQAVSLCALASALGVVFAGNFITLFVFWELLTFSTAILIFLKGTPHAVRMGTKFILFHLAGGPFLLLGILQQYAATGSFDLVVPEAGLLFFVIAFGFKTAFLPFHVWIAWGYPAASFFASIMLAGLTTKVGVYTVARILPFHPNIAIMGASMALFGVVCALLQKKLRPLLSYHIISQVGYMVAGVAIGSSLGSDGGLLHVVNHMIYKALLFMSVGVLIFGLGTENIHDLIHVEKKEASSPVWKVFPLAALGAVIGALAISGIPPFNGYVSKYLLKGAMSGISPTGWMLLIASVGTVMSFCKFVYFGFIKGRTGVKKQLPVTMKMSLVLMSILCLLFGIYPQPLANILPYGSSLAVYSTKGIMAALQNLVIGVLIFAAIRKLLEKGVSVPNWVSVEYLFYAPMGRLVLAICSAVNIIDRDIDRFYDKSGRIAYGLANKMNKFDSAIDEMQEMFGSSVYKAAKKVNRLDGAIAEMQEAFSDSTHNLAEKINRLDGAVEGLHNNFIDSELLQQYKHNEEQPTIPKTMEEVASTRGKEGFSIWHKLRWRTDEANIRNLNFSSFIVVVMMGVFLFFLAYYVHYF